MTRAFSSLGKGSFSINCVGYTVVSIPMVYDIAILQSSYETNRRHNTVDTNYKF